ncbi:MAG: hypothetical protein HQL29_02980 [Candidatus Omnitrophica bacterium]|nr:hypothetical protein [Candidatus Omnitrophota bacterium]
MKKINFIIFAFLFLFTGAICNSLENTDKSEVYYFYSSHCEECLYLKENVFPKIKNEFEGKIFWKEINIDESPENFKLALEMVFKNIKLGTIAPSIVIGDNVLMGVDKIESELSGLITKTLASDIPSLAINNDSLNKISPDSVYASITPVVILISGLIDGINPCAFAAIAFLISLLYVHSYKKKEIIVICLSYCFAVFLTYTLIGIGFFNILYSLKGFYKITRVFKILVAISCFIFALLSIYDSIIYKITGNAKSLLLVLPDKFKKKISLTIGSELRGNKKKNIIQLALGTFILGVIVSCVEMICTGQIYLPTLVYILKSPDHSFAALSYIILYNIMFIAPLLAVLALCLLGTTSTSFGEFLKKNTPIVKIALALVFIGLGLGIILF